MLNIRNIIDSNNDFLIFTLNAIILGVIWFQNRFERQINYVCS